MNQRRRPLKLRGLAVFQHLAHKLSQTAISPNQISLLSVVFAALAAAGFCWIAQGASPQVFWLVAIFIQLRLLCNLLDGMVAVEGGKSTKSGELFNDIPDRIADPLILVSAGYASQITWGMELGWLAGLLAVLTAYIRTLATSLGAPSNFSGPMAKQQRMAVLTAAAVLSVFEAMWLYSHWVLVTALIIIILGAIWTSIRRIRAAYRYLEQA